MKLVMVMPNYYINPDNIVDVEEIEYGTIEITMINNTKLKYHCTIEEFKIMIS